MRGGETESWNTKVLAPSALHSVVGITLCFFFFFCHYEAKYFIFLMLGLIVFI